MLFWFFSELFSVLVTFYFIIIFSIKKLFNHVTFNISLKLFLWRGNLDSGMENVEKFRRLHREPKTKSHTATAYFQCFVTKKELLSAKMTHTRCIGWLRCVRRGAHSVSLDFLLKTVQFQKLSHFRGCKWDFSIITIFIYSVSEWERNEKLWWC